MAQNATHRGDTLAALRNAFDILVRLQQGGATTADLAEDLGLSSRQITRYLNILEEFGVHFESDANGNRASPLRIAHTMKVQAPFNVLLLNQQELLLLYAQLSGLHHAGSNDDRTQLWEKVRRNLGTEPVNSDQLAGALGTFDKAYKSYDTPALRRILATLLEALYANRPCRVSYLRPGAEAANSFDVEPYQLFEAEGGLYCYCHLPWARAGNNRTLLLAVERIQELDADGTTTFTRQPDVVAEIELRKHRAFRITDDGKLVKFTVRFTKDAATHATTRIWHPSQSKPQWHQDGSVSLSFEATGIDEIRSWILGWGEAAVVELFAQE